MKIDRTLRIGVISSVVATIIFLYLLEPLLNLIGRLFLFFSEKISTFFIDRLYQEIASGKTDYSLSQMVVFILFIGGVMTIFLVLPRKLTNKETEEKKADRTAPRKRMIPKIIRMKFVRILLLILIWLVLILQLVSSHIKVSTINTFEQNIKIITPYIDTSKKDMLISKYCSMRSYEDYRFIIAEIEEIAKKNSINLPIQRYTYIY